MNLPCGTCPVRNSAACSVLSEHERGILAKAGRTRILKRSEMLFAAGDKDFACATLISGALKVVALDEEGNEQILALIHPAGFVGELFAPFANHDVVALTESQLCVFAKRDFEHAIERFPALSLALLRRSQEELHAARSLLELMGHGDAETRLAALLYDFAKAASHSPCHPAKRFELPVTRGEMANMLGLTIETVSRKLSVFEEDGVIKKYAKRGIELIDAERLQALSGRELI